MIVFNEGQPGRHELLTGTLGNPFTIPVVGLSFADGAALYQQTRAGAVTVSITTSTESRIARTRNVIADTPGGNADKVIVVGAHLDSVGEGPGINDNGSGTATILEIAEEMSELGIEPRQKVRFAFWGAEESGLLGSEHYVSSLSETALSKIYANLNFDMLGSPNFARFVYDGDGSLGGALRPARVGADRVGVLAVLRRPGPGQRADRVQRPLRLRPVHRGGHPRGRPVQRRRGRQDRGAGAALRRHRRRGVRRLLPRGLRRHHQPQHPGLDELADAAAHATLTLAKTRSGFFEDGSRRPTVRAAVAPQFEYSGSHAAR